VRFTGANIIGASLRYMSTTRWYHLGEVDRAMNNCVRQAAQKLTSAARALRRMRLLYDFMMTS